MSLFSSVTNFCVPIVVAPKGVFNRAESTFGAAAALALDVSAALAAVIAGDFIWPLFTESACACILSFLRSASLGLIKKKEATIITMIRNNPVNVFLSISKYRTNNY